MPTKEETNIFEGLLKELNDKISSLDDRGRGLANGTLAPRNLDEMESNEVQSIISIMERIKVVYPFMNMDEVSNWRIRSNPHGKMQISICDIKHPSTFLKEIIDKVNGELINL